MFLGRGPASWRHFGDTGGTIVCGRERGSFPRQVVRVARQRCERFPPQLIPLVPENWEGCFSHQRGISEVAALSLSCERATDLTRAIVAHAGKRPRGAVEAGHHRWRCSTSGPLPPRGLLTENATWYVARCDLGRHHLAIGSES